MDKKIEIKQRETFGRLEIVKELEPYIAPSGYKKRKFLCKCACGNVIEALLSNLRRGNTTSCGCLQKEKASKANKKFNTYKFFDNHVLGYTSKGDTFKVDLEDYEKIKDYYWYKDACGYLRADIDNKSVLLHRFILNPPNGMVVDHHNHDKSNNKKYNLRVCTQAQNCMNRDAKGVYFDKARNQWRAYIGLNNKYIHLGRFNSEEEALQARKLAEEKYFGEFACAI